MSDLVRAMLITVLIWAAILAIVFFLLNRRWLARFSNGFFLSLLLALAAISLMAASVVGAWGYEASKSLLSRGVETDLRNIADIVENQIRGDLEQVRASMASLAIDIAPLLQSDAPADRLRPELEAVQRVNKKYLQLNVYDENGQLVTSTTTKDVREPVNRIGAAYALDGKTFVSDAYDSDVFDRQVLYISTPVKNAGGVVVGALSNRFDIQTNLGELISAAVFNESGYAVIVRDDGRIIAHHDASRIGEDISSYAAVQAARQSGGSGAVVGTNKAGQERLMMYRVLDSPATVNPKPWILLTEIDESEAVAPLLQLRDEFAEAVGVLLLATICIAVVLSHSIQRPVDNLAGMVTKVAEGDLSARSTVTGHDVVGQLGARLNDMAAGLQERDRVKEIFGRYIATQVSDKILKGDVNLGGESRRVTILFSDIRSFSTMSEQLSPTQVVSFLNDYFSEMVDSVFEQGGVLDKFIGDGLMAVFGSLGDQPDHPRRAVLTALRMKAKLAKINGERSVAGKPPIAIGVGIHTDEVIVGNIGSRKRLEYTVIGDGVNTSSRVQTLNKEFGTTILITETTYHEVQGQFECRLMPEAQLRGKSKALRFYEVVSAKEAAL